MHRMCDQCNITKPIRVINELVVIRYCVFMPYVI